MRLSSHGSSVRLGSRFAATDSSAASVFKVCTEAQPQTRPFGPSVGRTRAWQLRLTPMTHDRCGHFQVLEPQRGEAEQRGAEP
jgi:hypothetical protein